MLTAFNLQVDKDAMFVATMFYIQQKYITLLRASCFVILPLSLRYIEAYSDSPSE